MIFHRVAWNPIVERQFQSLIARSALAVFDTDDLLFDPTAFRWIDSPDFQDPWRVELYQEEMQLYRTTLENCQAVIPATQYLTDRVRELGKPAWVHRNAFSLEMDGLGRSYRRERPTGARPGHDAAGAGAPAADGTMSGLARR